MTFDELIVNSGYDGLYCDLGKGILCCCRINDMALCQESIAWVINNCRIGYIQECDCPPLGNSHNLRSCHFSASDELYHIGVKNRELRGGE